ncbi:MAG TPA: bifunctional nuclease family protein [Bacteroidales bacterium]|nr:bifunctional nuclease family protein [Bacteroidales bacterium]HOH22091.1 bifunctional nuclease family protein [Bacteroidales bacterium]HPB57053.1 bifunctional nuclease family protein [Bacteroidales bacterium]HPZ03448.1 bifunctional nuclease family protein [Bacteroidales bacterium]HQB74773.1 bifunctional nuclease family protein [Bacteroidales bacterium]
MEDLLNLEIVDIRNSGSANGAFFLILKENNENKIVPIMIGETEAKAIATILSNFKSKRPSIHELTVDIIRRTGFVINSIYISRFENSIFYSTIVMEDGSKEIEIDSRTSDAIAIALLSDIPFKIRRSIFDKVATKVEEVELEDVRFIKEKDLLAHIEEEWDKVEVERISNDDLQILLDEAISEENFELAFKIHEELERRGK